ncbi:hypothetical protein HPB49_004987 [Dermacentor silvarum]|uniref:Uncharacterized protein n=1 Tax=Dermacentor silvarum TaxID=543639 RepID=A0ACB8CVG4_DERSI|nr:hypothetical protein HPB49_004987 [Dermacentor silvarum]
MEDALVNECKRLAERMQMAFSMSEPVVFSVELLLDTIKQYPVLYDKCSPRYKEADYKKELWKKIVQDAALCCHVHEIVRCSASPEARAARQPGRSEQPCVLAASLL